MNDAGKRIHKNKGNAKHSVSPHLKIWPGDPDLWPWKSIGFQILLRTKYVPSSEGQTEGSVIISLCNFVGEGIKKSSQFWR